MNPMEYPLKPEERVLFALRALYQSYGYSQFKMSKFEEYDLYVRNKDFLISDGVITFTDTDGRLMALKPDVTLSIIKNTRDLPGCVQRLCYSENVYRISGSTRSFKEIMQTGLECIGDVDLYCLCEVISLAERSLRIIDERCVLDLSHMGVVSALADGLGLEGEAQAALLKCIGEKNADGVRKLCPNGNIDGILALIAAHGAPEETIAALRPWCAEGAAKAALDELAAVTAALSAMDCDRVRVDFSIVNDMNYYNGIVFRGYIDGIPTGVLSGGQYDKLMQRMGRHARGIGFALYLDRLESLSREAREYDVDLLILLDEDLPPREVMALVRRYDDGKTRLSVQRALPPKLRCREVLDLRKRGSETC